MSTVKIDKKIAKEWSISEEECIELLQYLFNKGIITLKWLPEQNVLCFFEKHPPQKRGIRTNVWI